MFKKDKILLNLFFIFIFFISCTGNKGDNPQQYINNDYGFSLDFPKGWKKIDSVENAVVTFQAPENKASISVVVGKVPDGTLLDDFAYNIQRQIKKQKAEIVDLGKMFINGIDTRWMLIGISRNDSKYMNMQYYMVSGEKSYTIICSFASGFFSVEHISALEKVVKTFKFVTKTKQ